MEEMQKTWFWSLAQEDPQEEGITLHCSILAWEILWTGEPGKLEFIGSQKLDMIEVI